MADAAGLNPAAARRAGSNPALGTIRGLDEHMGNPFDFDSSYALTFWTFWYTIFTAVLAGGAVFALRYNRSQLDSLRTQIAKQASDHEAEMNELSQQRMDAQRPYVQFRRGSRLMLNEEPGAGVDLYLTVNVANIGVGPATAAELYGWVVSLENPQSLSSEDEPPSKRRMVN
jgi:hypothetical protein